MMAVYCVFKLLKCAENILENFEVVDPHSECDSTNYNMLLDQHLCWFWNNISINQSGDKFTVYVKFMLTTRDRCFYISVIHLSFPSDFKEKLWVSKYVDL